jgi:hypothetical protein
MRTGTIASLETSPLLPTEDCLLEVSNPSATSIASFKGGAPNMKATLGFMNGLTTLVHGSGLFLCGGVDWTPTAGCTITLVFNPLSGIWCEIGRSLPGNAPNLQDSVQAASTGASAASHTTGLTVDSATQHRLFCAAKSLPAKGVSMHAQDAGGAVLALLNFTNQLPRRTMNIARSDAGPASVDYTCTYKDPAGTLVQVTLAVPKNGNATTPVAGEWTNVVTLVDPVSTSDFVTGDGFSVGEAIQAASTPVLSCNGVVENAVSVELPSGTIVPTTAPDGAKGFAVAYAVTNAHPVTDAGHVHALTDPGHTHALA